MKFVALALAVLLAVGSQAKSLHSDVQSDSPSQLENFKAAATLYLTEVKETTQKILDNLYGTEYEEYKNKMSVSLENLQEYAEIFTPHGYAFSGQFLEATKDVRQKVIADVENLHIQLEPKREGLKQVLQKHLEDYSEKLIPVFQPYISKSMMEAEVMLRALIDHWYTKMDASVEEIKTPLMPMIEVVRTKLTKRLQELRSMVAPYAEEYKEQLVKAMGEVFEKVLPSKLEPYMDELKAKLIALYETVIQSLKA